jgi:hypothetical protein
LAVTSCDRALVVDAVVIPRCGRIDTRWYLGELGRQVLPGAAAEVAEAVLGAGTQE